MTFREECEEWLKPLGYTLHASSGEFNWLSFSHNDNHYSPAIICYQDPAGVRKCMIKGGHTLKMFIQTQVMDLQFKHPSIQKYISVFRHYEMVCDTHPPF